jgi:hypothetical protein
MLQWPTLLAFKANRILTTERLGWILIIKLPEFGYCVHYWQLLLLYHEKNYFFINAIAY